MTKKSGGRYNYTQDLVYDMTMDGAPVKMFFTAFGDIHETMDIRDCQAQDCLNPCYGENQWGACNRCIGLMLKNDMARDDVCNLCELGQESKPYSA